MSSPDRKHSKSYTKAARKSTRSSSKHHRGNEFCIVIPTTPSTPLTSSSPRSSRSSPPHQHRRHNSTPCDVIRFETTDRISDIHINNSTTNQNELIARISLNHSTDDDFVRILSLDAGGVRGILTLTVLDEIESSLNSSLPKSNEWRSIIEYFDLIAGVSTGSLIAVALSLPSIPSVSSTQTMVSTDRYGGDESGEVTPIRRAPRYNARQVLEHYCSIAPLIFVPRNHMKRVFRCKYDGRSLYDQLYRMIGETYLSETLIDVIITAYEIETRTPLVFSSYRARRDVRDDYRLVDIVMASCAAPTYFPPYSFSNRDASRRMWCVDGGVCSSNPCRRALNEAIHQYPGVPLDRYLVVSIGTGNSSRPIYGQQARRYCMFEWIRPIITITLDASATSTHHDICETIKELSGCSLFGYIRFQTRLVAASTHMDDVSIRNISALRLDGKRLMNEHENTIQRLISVLEELDDSMSCECSSSITTTPTSTISDSSSSSSAQT